MQNRTADLVVERRGLVRIVQEGVNEAAALQRQEAANGTQEYGVGESDAEAVIVGNLQDGGLFLQLASLIEIHYF